MNKLIQYFDSKFYPSFTPNWDDKIFKNYLEKFLNKDMTVLDIGAGAGIVQEMNFKGKVKQINGVDPDSRVLENPYLDFAYVGFGEEMPFFEDEKFDIVFCDNVYEHVENPVPFLQEVHRVLKRGGKLIAKTPNKNHYMPLIASLTPTWFHKFYNRIRGRNPDDTFKTHYKINSYSQQKNLAEKTGFNVYDITFIEGRPEYLRISVITYLAGIIYERIVNKFTLNKYKILLISTWIKI